VSPLFLGGDLGPHLTQCRLGRGLSLYKWHLDPSSRLATTDIIRKVGLLCSPFFWGGSLVPAWAESYLHVKFHFDSASGLATTHQRYRQTGHDRQRSDSITANRKTVRPKTTRKTATSGINILAGGSSVPLISERKETDPHWKHLRCTHFGS